MSADHKNDMNPHVMVDFAGAESRVQDQANLEDGTRMVDLENTWGRVTERLP